MGVLTYGHQAVFRVIEETTVGTFPTNPALILLSKAHSKTKLKFSKNLQEAPDQGEYEVDEFYSAKNTYEVELEFIVYNVPRFLDYWERTSTGAPRAWSWELIPNEDAATKHWIRGSGWKCKTAKLTGRLGEAWLATVSLVGGTISDPVTTDPGIGTGSREARSAISDALRSFASGAITFNGSAWATLLGSIEITCDHGTEPRHTTGNADPVPGATTHGKRRITGTVDISLDDAFKEHFDRVKALAEHTIVIPFGAAGQPKLTLTGVRLPDLDGETGADVDVLMGNQPFVAETFTEGTV